MLCYMHSLNSVLCVSDGVHISGTRDGLGLYTGKYAGLVHKLEHNLHPLALFAQEIPHTLSMIAKIKGRGCVSLQAHLVFDS